ncbi:MAG: SIR2 family protein [Alphaproteobacteria bacterium]
MRFIANGPSIPHRLLLARDEGRVVFFCGAGVSKARAKLPNFFELARKVIKSLGAQPDSKAVKLLKLAKKIDPAIGVPGIVSADRIFGLLERDFLQKDIEEKVGLALKPKKNCDVSAHRILIDLARTKEGRVRIVTTNFDRLFNECDSDLRHWLPPCLPDPSRPSDLDGVIYLHGRASEKYTVAEGNGFVLSSSEFGRAYLSDGWATKFIRDVLEKFVVVFVGYSADDPPVQYLLEALRKTSGKLDGVYAFQSGNSDDAVARWVNKGIEAIPYDDSNSHSALWETLEAWAIRARDPDLWTDSIIELALRGPEALLPHERGQVAHVVSTIDGMRKFSQSEPSPPAEWLCVFDRNMRYAKPGYQIQRMDEQGPFVNPFDSYGLDSDIVPPSIAPDDHNTRKAPPGSWDAFALNALDRSTLIDANLSTLRGHWAVNSPQLTRRIELLGDWIAKVSDQPATVWWAAHQSALHSYVKNQIRLQLERPECQSTPEIRKAWRFLFDSRSGSSVDFDGHWYGLAAQIKKDDWDSMTVRQFAEISRPYFEYGPVYWYGPKPPRDNELQSHSFYKCDVKYPDGHERLDIPAAWIAETIKALRYNLEHALALETEIGGYGLMNISPICHDEFKDGETFSRTYGLSKAVIEFALIFERLINLDVEKARREYTAWPIDDDTIFARLRIWALGFPEVIPPEQFERTVASISDNAFWDARHQRDLLIVLKRRWNDIPEQSRSLIEARILGGPSKWETETDTKFEERSAWAILDRIHWFLGEGCVLSVDPKELKKRLGPIAPNWQESYAAKAAESREGRGGWVKTETEHSELLEVELASLLSVAQEKSGRTEDFLVENDPFAGLVISRPVRAFTALVLATKRFEYPQRYWEKFLYSQARKDDRPRLVIAIARRLAQIPLHQLGEIIHAATEWLSKVVKILAFSDRDAFDCIVKRLVDALKSHSALGSSQVIRGSREPDWVTEAINAPIGKIAEALFKDPRIDNLQKDAGLPVTWLAHVRELLTLEGEMRRHCLVIMFYRINWFDHKAPTWTSQNLLCALEGRNELDHDAAWAGLLWRGQMLSAKLFMLLKPMILKLVVSRLSSKREYENVLASMMLSAWAKIMPETKRTGLSDDEFRSLLIKANDGFRLAVLRQLENSISRSVEEDAQKNLNLMILMLSDVWPRQISARSSAVCARLTDFAFSSDENFNKIADAVLPLLTKIESERLRIPRLYMERNSIPKRYPEKTLAILATVLPDNVSAWPYGIDSILIQIGEADNRLSTDERLIELMRRWAAR